MRTITSLLIAILLCGTIQAQEVYVKQKKKKKQNKTEQVVVPKANTERTENGGVIPEGSYTIVGLRLNQSIEDDLEESEKTYVYQDSEGSVSFDWTSTPNNEVGVIGAVIFKLNGEKEKSTFRVAEDYWAQTDTEMLLEIEGNGYTDMVRFSYPEDASEPYGNKNLDYLVKFVRSDGSTTMTFYLNK